MQIDNDVGAGSVQRLDFGCAFRFVGFALVFFLFSLAELAIQVVVNEAHIGSKGLWVGDQRLHVQ